MAKPDRTPTAARTQNSPTSLPLSNEPALCTGTASHLIAEIERLVEWPSGQQSCMVPVSMQLLAFEGRHAHFRVASVSNFHFTFEDEPGVQNGLALFAHKLSWLELS